MTLTRALLQHTNQLLEPSSSTARNVSDAATDLVQSWLQSGIGQRAFRFHDPRVSRRTFFTKDHALTTPSPAQTPSSSSSSSSHDQPIMSNEALPLPVDMMDENTEKRSAVRTTSSSGVAVDHELIHFQLRPQTDDPDLVFVQLIPNVA
jgi:hypothetical protein